MSNPLQENYFDTIHQVVEFINHNWPYQLREYYKPISLALCREKLLSSVMDIISMPFNAQ